MLVLVWISMLLPTIRVCIILCGCGRAIIRLQVDPFVIWLLGVGSIRIVLKQMMEAMLYDLPSILGCWRMRHCGWRLQLPDLFCLRKRNTFFAC